MKFAKVREYQSPILAHFDAEKLELAGLMVRLENQQMASLYGNVLGGIILIVPENQLNKAQEILRNEQHP